MVRSWVALLVVAAAWGGGSCSCDPPLPSAPTQCDARTGTGCLPDETCEAGFCKPLPRCESDDDCPSLAFRCVFPAQFCELRDGFGEECSDVDGIPCGGGQFCALGRCRDVAESRECGTRLDCAPGFTCDQVHFYCIEDAPCTFANEGYPELACNAASETCNEALGQCVSECLNQCDPLADDCPGNLRCNAACTCVTCLSNEDCGAGLICNIRAGRCQSESLCFDDSDCGDALICDVRTQLCQVPPPPCEDDFDCQIAEICNLELQRCELPGGVCIDDRFEEGDTPANAQELIVEAGAPTKLFDDLVLCPGDDDVYAVDLAAGDQLRVQVIERPSDPALAGLARATVYLLDSAAETSLDFSEVAPRGDGTMFYVADVDERVYVRVSALLAVTFYDMELEKTSGQSCQNDVFEGAVNNDDFATAHVVDPVLVDLGVALAGEICGGDTDFYAVDVAPGEGLDIRLAFSDLIDLDVAVFDSANVLVENAAGISQPEQLQKRFINGGRVLVRVRPFANQRGPYELTLRRLPPFVCSDAFENDDATARAIVVPNTVSGLPPVSESRAICGNAALPDADRWQVDVEDFERLVVRALPADDDLRVVLAVEDAAGVQLKRSAIGPGASALGFDAPATGTYFVRATGAFGQTGNYTVLLSKENQTACAPDAAEPNDTRATLRALPAGDATTFTGDICESDEDFFGASASAGKLLTVELSFLHGDADLDLQVLGLVEGQLLATSDGQVDGERLSLIVPADGVYPIRVFALTSGAKAEYTLSTTVTSP